MKKLDTHAAGLKMTAMAARSLALLPVVAILCTIYGETKTLSVLFAYLVSLPAMAVGYLMYYYDQLFHQGKKTWFGKGVIVVFSAALLGFLDFLLLFTLMGDMVMGVCVVPMIAILFYWGYRAGDGSYSEVLPHLVHIIILILYFVYVAVTGFMWMSSKGAIDANHDPVVLGAVLYGILSMIVTNQASVDYELQNQDAESADARRQIQRFNMRLSLVPAALVLVGYFFRGPLTQFLSGLFSTIRDAVVALFSLRGPTIEFEGNEMESMISQPTEQASELGGQFGKLFHNAVPYLFVLGMIILIIIFRKRILRAFQVSVKFFSGLWAKHAKPKRQAATQYYQDLVEELDEQTVLDLFGQQEKKTDSIRRQLRDYGKETDPQKKVRRALPLLKQLAKPDPAFAPGETAREMTARMEGDRAKLDRYADLYDQVRYNDHTATQQEGEAAAALVKETAERK